jgi:hypothetical protein
MHPAPPPPRSYLGRPTWFSGPAAPDWRSRLASFLLAAATTVLIALLMLAMGARRPGEKGTAAHLVAVQISPESPKHIEHAHAAAKQAPAHPVQQHPTPHPPVVKPPVPVTPFVTMSKQDFAASDISRLPKHGQGDGSGSGTGSGSSTYGPSEGPGGVHLFNAEWYREPTDPELSTYLRQANGAGSGDWATIACRTIEHYHVENCQELDESPPGSGLARALRQASWQFLVRPPRVDGKVLIGSWVRIKFTFTGHRNSIPTEALPGADDGR